MITQKLLLDSTKVGILSVVLGYLIIFVMNENYKSISSIVILSGPQLLRVIG